MSGIGADAEPVQPGPRALTVARALGGAENGPHDRAVPGAAADVAAQMLADLAVGRVRRLGRAGALAAMIMPGVQKPHWSAACSTNACWIGCSRSPSASPSTVSTCLPAASKARKVQALTGSSSTRTVQAPQICDIARPHRAEQPQPLAEHVQEQIARLDSQRDRPAVDDHLEIESGWRRSRGQRLPAREQASRSARFVSTPIRWRL